MEIHGQLGSSPSAYALDGGWRATCRIRTVSTRPLRVERVEDDYVPMHQRDR